MIAATWAADVGAIGTAVVAGGVVFGFVGWGLRAFIRDEVREIKKEIKPNGGDSMRDALDRTERTVERIERDSNRRHAENKELIRGLTRRVERLEDR